MTFALQNTAVQDKAHSQHRATWNNIRDVLISNQYTASVRKFILYSWEL